MMGVLKYVTQACKTMLDDQWMVTGHNCVARASYLEMMTTKQQFRKTDGRQFYYFVQFFPATVWYASVTIVAGKGVS